MKTVVGKFLTFIPVATPKKQKTQVWHVYSTHSSDFLGKIHWRNGWRRYVMSFEDYCDWSVECMCECYKFVQKLMQDHKNR